MPRNKKTARKRANNRRPAADDSGWGVAGEDARAEMERARAEAEANRQKGWQPLRFFQGLGEEVEIVILDNDLHSFMGNEHHLKHSNGKWGNFQSCCNQFAHCAICENYPDHRSYRVLFLTVLVRQEWTDAKGNKHPYSRMLLPIKQGQHEKFIEIEKIAKKNSPTGSLRGVMLRMKRGRDKQSINIGEPTAFEDGNLLDYYTEDELLEEFGHDEILNRDKEVIVEENGNLQPFDYFELFPKPDPEAIAAQFGSGTTTAGSTSDRDDEFGDEDSEEEDDDVPMHHSFKEKGDYCDDDDSDEDTVADYEQELLEKSEELDLVADDYESWKLLGAEIDSKLAKPKTRAKKKTTAKKSAGRRRRRKGTEEPFD